MPKKTVSVSFFMEPEKLAMIDEICQTLEIPRSEFCRIAAHNALTDWDTMKSMGLTPMRVKKLAKTLRKLGLIKEEREFIEHGEPA